MTRAERENPDIISASRKKRIAAGSGTSVEDVNKLLRSFDQVKKLMKQFKILQIQDMEMVKSL